MQHEVCCVSSVEIVEITNQITPTYLKAKLACNSQPLLQLATWISKVYDVVGRSFKGKTILKVFFIHIIIKQCMFVHVGPKNIIMGRCS